MSKGDGVPFHINMKRCKKSVGYVGIFFVIITQSKTVLMSYRLCHESNFVECYCKDCTILCVNKCIYKSK